MASLLKESIDSEVDEQVYNIWMQKFSSNRLAQAQYSDKANELNKQIVYGDY